MINSKNNTTLVGNLVSNVEIKHTKNSTVSNITVALNNSYPNKETGEIIVKTTYVDCTWWKPSEILPDVGMAPIPVLAWLG